MSSVGMFIRRRLWIGPILAVIVLSIVGYTVRSAVESTMRDNLASQLQTLLTVETAMLRTWYANEQASAISIANDRQTRETIAGLLNTSGNNLEESNEEALQKLESELAPGLASHEFSVFFVADKDGVIRTASDATLIGRENVPQLGPAISAALDGNTTITPPFAGITPVKLSNGDRVLGAPVMYVCVPVRDADFQVIGTLGLRIHADREFTRILQLGRIGESGETYAFDRSAIMVSNSRFDNDLILLGILPDTDMSRSILQVRLRDPGGDMTEGYRPTVRVAERPMTVMAASATAGDSGVNVDGYRDYRGVVVVGAWQWIPKLQIGVTTEIDYSEAFRPLTILQRAFWTLYGMLTLAAVAIFVFTVIVARLQREAQEAAIEAKQLGQYTLDEEIGAGAMGVVYRGHHAMMRRETAIKMLNPDTVTDGSIERFEREVQITCRLTHPNTIAIYDYGRTPEGLFYYAMEYLDGIDLQSLVERYGPQPEARVCRILTQICGSLFEAHSHGLVHRDIKPANLILSHRGGEPDILKVLDFGLVRAADEQKQARLTSAGSLTGTPLYMSPEAIQSPLSVDSRSDIYAVGAVAYYLLTGTPVFTADNLVNLCRMHTDETPEPPSKRRQGVAISPNLEAAILSCLEKPRSDRPGNARELADLITRGSADTWDIEKYETWWTMHQRGDSVNSIQELQNSADAISETHSGNKTALNQTMIVERDAEPV